MEPIVEPLDGDRSRCFVHSRTEAGVKHLVDLEEYGGNGACSCANFRFRCQPALERGAERSRRLQCAHIREAKIAFYEYWLDLLLAAENKRR